MRVLISTENRGGFTLIEVMMAILILMVGMLGLLSAINLAAEVNIRNQVREEAVYLGERVMNEMRGVGFANIPVAATPTDLYNYTAYPIQSKIRGASSRIYTVRKSSKVISDDTTATTKQLEVVISWPYKGVTYENRVVAPISMLR